LTIETNILEIPVLKVVQALGLEVKEQGGKHWIKCPFTHHEHDDTNPQCEVGGKKNLVRCFKCGTTKDNLGLVMQVLSYEPLDAANWLCREFGVPRPGEKGHKTVDPISMLANLRGWSNHAFDILDCRCDKDCVIFPMRDENGKQVGIKKRKGNNTTFKWYNRSVKSYTPRKNKHGLFYPKDGLAEEAPVLILEGEADTIAALSAGAQNVIGTAGDSPGPVGEKALQAMMRNRKAVLFPDPRASGRKWLNQVGELLLNVQCKVQFVPAEKKDLDGRLKYEKDKHKALKALLALAVDFTPVDPAKDFSLPRITVNEYLLDSLTRQSLSALEEKNDPPSIFVRTNKLVRVLRDEDGHIIVDVYGKSSMRLRLAECARFVYEAENDEYFKKPPDDVVEAILTLGKWPFPPLRGVTGAPILRDDGSVCTESGYDEQTAMYYSPADNFTMPDIPEEPTEEDIEKAKELLLDVIHDFPFSDQASRANSLAFLFTMLMRHVIDGYVPLCLVDAPTQGTGKGKLVKNLGTIALGDELASQSAPHGRYAEEEWRKLLIAILRQGAPAVLFDNISEREVLDSAPLAGIITSGNYSGRILGQSDSPTFRVNISWVATGNNIKVTGDMPRRCYTIRLDSNLERPWERDPKTFRHPSLERYVRENRVNLLAAAFTVIRSWYVAGKPKPENIPVMGSFIEWSEAVGGVLENAGIDGFLQNQEALRLFQDDESLQWQAFFDAWYETFGESHISTVEICSQIMLDNTEMSKTLPDILLAAKERGEGSLKRSMGRRLSRMSGKIFSGRKLHFTQDSHRKTKLWMLSGSGEGPAGFAGFENQERGLDFEKTPPTESTQEDSTPQDMVEDDSLRGLRGNGADATCGSEFLFDDEKKNLPDESSQAANPANPHNPAENSQNGEIEKLKQVAGDKTNPANSANPAETKMSQPNRKKIPEIELGPASNTANPASESEKDDKDVQDGPE